MEIEFRVADFPKYLPDLPEFVTLSVEKNEHNEWVLKDREFVGFVQAKHSCEYMFFNTVTDMFLVFHSHNTATISYLAKIPSLL